MAGHDLQFNDPVHVSLELDLFVCVARHHFRGDVRAGLLEVLGSRLPDGRRGVFHPDNFSFGQTGTSARSTPRRIEVPGVESVHVTHFHRRGRQDTAPLDDGLLRLGRLEIARLDNDPNFPEHGCAAARALGRQMMAGTAPHTTDCGCCAGLDRETPRRIANTAGMSAIAYRVGTWAQFKESMLTRLSSSSTPALAGLTTRADDDFTIALCDALAMSLDVLTFYQERIANEHYLRTATERRSMVEMARLIGYQPAPGVAASTHLAFTLHETPGDPASAPVPIRVPVGTRVQSVPGQDEQPQSFETVAEVEARAEWKI